MQKKGISLIVLVITIIVMIILAGAVIISLSNSGIIGNANRAVKISNEATVKELAQTAWLDAYADGVRSVEDEGVTKGLKTRVEEALRKNGINQEAYLINVTTSGVTVKSIDRAWVKDGFTVRKGDKVLEIGDIVNYDETAGGTKTGLVQTQWQVLGADDEGNLLIKSTAWVKEEIFIAEDNKIQQGWLNTPQIIHTACEPYGYGKGAVGKARSITVEDINNITGFDPTNVDGNGTPFRAGTIAEYGNKVTYKYGGTEEVLIDEGGDHFRRENHLKITYEGTNGVSGTYAGTIDEFFSGEFHYYDGREFKHITDLATGPIGTAFAEVTCSSYHYDASNYINSTENSKVYQMLFEMDRPHFIASIGVLTEPTISLYNIFYNEWGYIASDPMWYSSGYVEHNSGSFGWGVWAVVTLSSDIDFTGSSSEGWSY